MRNIPNYDEWKLSGPDEGEGHKHRCEFCDADCDDGVEWFADMGEWLCPEHREETVRCNRNDGNQQ